MLVLFYSWFTSISLFCWSPSWVTFRLFCAEHLQMRWNVKWKDQNSLSVSKKQKSRQKHWLSTLAELSWVWRHDGRRTAEALWACACTRTCVHAWKDILFFAGAYDFTPTHWCFLELLNAWQHILPPTHARTHTETHRNTYASRQTGISHRVVSVETTTKKPTLLAHSYLFDLNAGNRISKEESEIIKNICEQRYELIAPYSLKPTFFHYLDIYLYISKSNTLHSQN